MEAPNDFTLRVGLRSPVPFFLQIAAAAPLAAVPCQAIRAARDRGEESSWTRPGRIVVSGPFRLQEWRSYDRVVLRRNPSYYNAERLLLDELSFVHIADGVTNVNLYKAGEADAMADSILPPQFLPALQRVGELHVLPALDNYYYFVNLNKPPLNNVLLRYALNMALDKNALATFAGVGRTPAKNFVPPIAGYPAPQKLNVNVNGRECDVLSYNPPTARELLAAAGLAAGVCPNGRRLRLNLSYWNRPMSRERCEILQQVWHRNLGIELSLVALELPVWLQSVTSGEYEGLADVDWNADYADPDAFLSLLTSSSSANGSGWRDPAYDAMLASANTETDLAVRMRKLVDCEEYMLRRMPVIPLYFDAWTYLQKPFVRDLYIDPLARVTFPSAWIDTKWRPS